MKLRVGQFMFESGPHRFHPWKKPGVAFVEMVKSWIRHVQALPEAFDVRHVS